MDKFYISTNKAQLDLDVISDFLTNRSYWAKGRSRETIEKSIDNSLCFGLYDHQDKQVGFARVVSDLSVFAWLMDVFILEEHRGKGLGTMLMKEIMAFSELHGIRRWDSEPEMRTRFMKNSVLRAYQNQKVLWSAQLNPISTA